MRGPSSENQHWVAQGSCLVLPRSLVPCHYTNFKIKHVADIGVTKVLPLGQLVGLSFANLLVKRTSIGKDKILSSRGNAEGPYSPWAIRRRPYPKQRRTRRRFAQSKTEALATRQKVSVPRGIFGFPDEFITTIRYVDVYTLTSASNGIAKQYMRMNSLFDPDQTGTGHQPYYFDQFAALYNRYTVLGSKLTAEFSLLPSDCYSSAVRPSCY